MDMDMDTHITDIRTILIFNIKKINGFIANSLKPFLLSCGKMKVLS